MAEIEAEIKLPPPQALRLQPQAGELEARETGDEHSRDHVKEKGERQKRENVSISSKFCRFLVMTLFPRF